MKYEVTLEFLVKSCDLLDITVEAENEEEARKLAIKKYQEHPEDYEDFYASDYYETELDYNNKDIMVYPLEG